MHNRHSCPLALDRLIAWQQQQQPLRHQRQRLWSGGRRRLEVGGGRRRLPGSRAPVVAIVAFGRIDWVWSTTNGRRRALVATCHRHVQQKQNKACPLLVLLHCALLCQRNNRLLAIIIIGGDRSTYIHRNDTADCGLFLRFSVSASLLLCQHLLLAFFYIIFPSTTLSLSPTSLAKNEIMKTLSLCTWMCVCPLLGIFRSTIFALCFDEGLQKTLISSSFSLLFVQRRSQSEPWINRLVGHSYRAKAALTLHVWLGALCALCVTAAAVAVVVAKKGGVSASTRATRSSVGRLSADKIDSISCS